MGWVGVNTAFWLCNSADLLKVSHSLALVLWTTYRLHNSEGGRREGRGEIANN